MYTISYVWKHRLVISNIKVCTSPKINPSFRAGLLPFLHNNSNRKYSKQNSNDPCNVLTVSVSFVNALPCRAKNVSVAVNTTMIFIICITVMTLLTET